jgi:hypothetical protein
MNVTRSTVSMLTIAGAPGTDPIRVVTENYAPGQGRIIIQCWDRSWTAAWFAMNGQSIEQFFAEAGWDYAMSNLTQGLSGMRRADAKRSEPYLRRIIETVQKVFRDELTAPVRDPRVPESRGVLAQRNARRLA